MRRIRSRFTVAVWNFRSLAPNSEREVWGGSVMCVRSTTSIYVRTFTAIYRYLVRRNSSALATVAGEIEPHHLFGGGLNNRIPTDRC